MRRPAPIPQTPEPEAEPPRRIRAPRRTEEERPAAEEEKDTAAEETTTPEEDAPLTARDVWRAARARRKALRAEIRRFTQKSRRRRWTWIGVLAAIVLVVGGSVAATYSPLFAVEKITVVGTSSLDPDAVAQALEGEIGTPLAAVDESDVKAALTAFPLIETYALEARPPHELTVRIVERTPIGVLSSDAGYSLVDAAGVVLSTTETIPDGQPVLEIEGGAGSSAFESAGLVIRSLSADIRPTVTKVTATTADDVTLTLSSGKKVVWGGSDDSVLKATVLTTIMGTNPDASTYDVTSPNVPVIG